MRPNACFRLAYLTIMLLVIVKTIFDIKHENKRTARNSEELQNSKYEAIKCRIKGPLKHDDLDLLLYLISNVLEAPSVEPYNLSTNRYYQNTMHSYGWEFIHKVIKSLFNDMENGFFVEAGALDGEFLSNSLWLEQTLNWTGLLVEPDITNFREMVWKRRKAWLSHSCLSDETFPKEIILVSTRKKNTSPMLSILARGGSLQFDQINKTKQKEVSFFYGETDFSYVNCQCYPLYSYLTALNRSTIDFFSLDIQGTEIEVFNTIPLDKIFIRSFIIEDFMRIVNYKLISHFNKLGFALFKITYTGPDYFFINKKDPILMEKALKIGMLQKYVDQHLEIKILGL